MSLDLSPPRIQNLQSCYITGQTSIRCLVGDGPERVYYDAAEVELEKPWSHIDSADFNNLRSVRFFRTSRTKRDFRHFFTTDEVYYCRYEGAMGKYSPPEKMGAKVYLYYKSCGRIQTDPKNMEITFVEGANALFNLTSTYWMWGFLDLAKNDPSAVYTVPKSSHGKQSVRITDKKHPQSGRVVLEMHGTEDDMMRDYPVRFTITSQHGDKVETYDLTASGDVAREIGRRFFAFRAMAMHK